MYVAILLSLSIFVACCHGNESIDAKAIQDKGDISLDKRSDGLMAELVHLLDEQRQERRGILKRCKMAENMVQKLTKDLIIIKNSVGQLRKKMVQQHIKIERKTDATTQSIAALDSRTKQSSSRIVMLQKQIRTIQKTKGLFGKKDGIGFSVRLRPLHGNKLVNIGSVVKFDDVISNYGNRYSTDTGKFTCTTPGLYMFHLTVVSKTNWGYAYIVKNTTKINLALSTLDPQLLNNNNNGKTRFESGSTSAVVALKVGDEVWVKSGSNTNTTSYEWHSAFSGVLISE